MNILLLTGAGQLSFMLTFNTIVFRFKLKISVFDEQIKIRLIMGLPLIRDGSSSLLLGLRYQLQARLSSGKQLIANLSTDDLPLYRSSNKFIQTNRYYSGLY